jgi:hypothetical protein
MSVQHKAQHGEIQISSYRAPSIITRGDMHQAVNMLYHRYNQSGDARHYGPAIDAVLRLIAAAPAELIKQVRVVEGEAQDGA